MSPTPDEIAQMNTNLRDAVIHYLDGGVTMSSLADDSRVSINKLRDFLEDPNDPRASLTFDEGYRLGQSLGPLMRAEEADREEMPAGRRRNRMVTGGDLWMGAKSEPVRDSSVRRFTLEGDELIEE